MKKLQSGLLDATKAAKIAELPKDVQETVLEDAERNEWSGKQMVEEAERLSVELDDDPVDISRRPQRPRSTLTHRLRHAAGVLRREIEIVKEHSWRGVNRADARALVMDIVKFIDKD